MERGLTQGDLAAKVGISREHLVRVEAGQHDPAVSLLLKIARALRVKVSALLE